ncbi:hypothetical protein HED60_23125 [Planctomycetales bacterium ZRK34]|nr:hypothetical protein HED60_23125 [Planctomycetales bacterium ZRK34]
MAQAARISIVVPADMADFPIAAVRAGDLHDVLPLVLPPHIEAGGVIVVRSLAAETRDTEIVSGQGVLVDAVQLTAYSSSDVGASASAGVDVQAILQPDQNVTYEGGAVLSALLDGFTVDQSGVFVRRLRVREGMQAEAADVRVDRVEQGVVSDQGSFTETGVGEIESGNIIKVTVWRGPWSGDVDLQWTASDGEGDGRREWRVRERFRIAWGAWRIVAVHDDELTTTTKPIFGVGAERSTIKRRRVLMMCVR